MTALRVLHVPHTVGGHPQGLSRAERELGLDSTSVALAPSSFGYDPDVVLRPPGTSRLRYEWRRAGLLAHAIRSADVVHFNFGSTIVPPVLRNLDLPLLRRTGKVIAVTFQGDDARLGSVAHERGGLSLPTALPDRYGPDRDRARAAVIARFARHAQLLYFLNPDLAPGLPSRAQFVPYAHVEPRVWRRSLGGRETGAHDTVLRVLHAPSDREVKGTHHLERAISELRTQGVPIELLLVEGIPHRDVRSLYATADVAVDQLFAGWYGGFAVEAMALGVPVVGHIRSEDLGCVPPELAEELPVIRATPDSIRDVLRGLVADRSRVAELGARSRAYVERWHDPRTIAGRMVSDYELAARSIGRSSMRR